MPWSMNVGIPFKKIKDRSKKALELEMIYLQEEKQSEQVLRVKDTEMKVGKQKSN